MAKAQKPTVTSEPADGDTLVAQVRGEIDYSSSPDLRNELMLLLQQSPSRLIIDLSGVPYMDSSGVATLIEALQVQRRAEKRLVLCGLQPKVRGIFEIARLDGVFSIAETAAAAREA